MLGYAVLAVPAILLAIDMLVAHRWFPEPAATTQIVGSTIDDTGSLVDITTTQLTADGRAQHRRDLALGGFLLLGGVTAMGWSLKELIYPTVILRGEVEGISVRVDGPRHPPRLYPWDEVVEVHSGVRASDGADISVLSLHLTDPDQVPANPAGGEADPPWLHIYADEWDTPAHQVAPILDQMCGRVRPEGGDE